MTKKTVTLLGSTGSIGLNTLQVLRAFRGSFEVRGLAAGSQTDLLKKQIEEFSPKAVYIRDPQLCLSFSKPYQGSVRFFSEKEGLREFSTFLGSDILVAATTGTSALLPVLDALAGKKKVALANKEILVIAGGLLMSKLKQSPGALLIPVDSEHNAIFQCLEGNPAKNVEKIILTGSGGPLREIAEDRFKLLSKEVVINHPKWKMGRKISVDSATLMNKGLEIIEASWLFDTPVEKIEILIHPEAVIHSMVEFKDGVVLAQLGVTDMKLPIQHALCYPERFLSAENLRLDFSKVPPLTFAEPDRKKFPCLGLAYEAAKKSGSAPCVLSAADEVAVGAYLEDKINFLEIPQVIEKVLSNHRHVSNPDLDQIQAIHHWAVEETLKLCQAR